MRKPLIVANWKMNLTVEDGEKFMTALFTEDIDYNIVDVVIAPSFTSLYPLSNLVMKGNAPIAIAAQNMYVEQDGAYTGEVSISMIKGAGATQVILGHSERRNIFGETDSFINKKVNIALNSGLGVILCVGEKEEERDAKVEVEVVLSQVGKCLKDVSYDDMNNIVIAYEPVWAIGTGKTASSGDVERMHKRIRAFIKQMYNTEISESIKILYGGSVKPGNVKELMSMEDIDGALVGGASLKVESFIKLINFKNN